MPHHYVIYPLNLLLTANILQFIIFFSCGICYKEIEPFLEIEQITYIDIIFVQQFYYYTNFILYADNCANNIVMHILICIKNDSVVLLINVTNQFYLN